MDYTGTGNTLDVGHPAALALMTDSLRYWVTEMHVDGFRFDLAVTLARDDFDVSMTSGFFKAVGAGPGFVYGQTHRRALGRGAQRLPGGGLSLALGGVERALPRHGARLLAGRRRVRRPRQKGHGQLGFVCL